MNDNANAAVLEEQDVVVTKKYFYFFVKRIFDIVISLVGLVLLIPTAIIVKLAYMITGDFKSIFYTQERIGKNGKKIGIYKFRSMVPKADEMLKKLIQKEPYKTQWKENHKLDNDPRITKVGNILRKTSLDELPQFINVFLGDMSMIGPRPLVDGELDEHNGNHELYESIKPGITGWWACNGRSALTYDERLALEYYYIHNCSILLDIKCVLLTIKIVIFKTGAK